ADLRSGWSHSNTVVTCIVSTTPLRRQAVLMAAPYPAGPEPVSNRLAQSHPECYSHPTQPQGAGCSIPDSGDSSWRAHGILTQFSLARLAHPVPVPGGARGNRHLPRTALPRSQGLFPRGQV